MIGRKESGYALLMVIFLAAVMSITAAVAVPRVLQEARREKEEELIWRGKQYARAVKLFYRKNGRFPTSLEDLTKPTGPNNVRFLRQEYKDPFNRPDGSWRLIYVGPGGQLIGSVKSGLPGQSGPMIQMPGAVQGVAGSGPGTGQQTTPPAGQVGQAGQQQQQTNASAFGQPAQLGTPVASLASGGTGQVFGGNIIGVGSKVDQQSIKIYDNGTTYRQWEFIWDPAKDPLIVGGSSGTTIGTPAGTPAGGTPPAGTNPPPPQGPNQ